METNSFASQSPSASSSPLPSTSCKTSSSISNSIPKGVSPVGETLLPFLLLTSPDARCRALNHDMALLSIDGTDLETAQRALQTALGLFEDPSASVALPFTPSTRSNEMSGAKVDARLCHWYNAFVVCLQMAVVYLRRIPMDESMTREFAAAAREHYLEYMKTPQNVPDPLIPLIEHGVELSALLMIVCGDRSIPRIDVLRKFQTLVGEWTQMANNVHRTHTALILLPIMSLQLELSLWVWCQELVRYSEQKVLLATAHPSMIASLMRKALGVYHLLQLFIADVSGASPYAEYTAIWQRWAPTTTTTAAAQPSSPSEAHPSLQLMTHPFHMYGVPAEDPKDTRSDRWLEFQVKGSIADALKRFVGTSDGWPAWQLPRPMQEEVLTRTTQMMHTFTEKFGAAPFHARDQDVSQYIMNVKKELFQ